LGEGACPRNHPLGSNRFARRGTSSHIGASPCPTTTIDASGPLVTLRCGAGGSSHVVVSQPRRGNFPSVWPRMVRPRSVAAETTRAAAHHGAANERGGVR
jgi:hypothetical protein